MYGREKSEKGGELSEEDNSTNIILGCCSEHGFRDYIQIGQRRFPNFFLSTHISEIFLRLPALCNSMDNDLFERQRIKRGKGAFPLFYIV